jgi:hypothetical protein
MLAPDRYTHDDENNRMLVDRHGDYISYEDFVDIIDEIRESIVELRSSELEDVVQDIDDLVEIIQSVF